MLFAPEQILINPIVGSTWSETVPISSHKIGVTLGFEFLPVVMNLFIFRLLRCHCDILPFEAETLRNMDRTVNC
jgi:hypothetical protein